MSKVNIVTSVLIHLYSTGLLTNDILCIITQTFNYYNKEGQNVTFNGHCFYNQATLLVQPTLFQGAIRMGASSKAHAGYIGCLVHVHVQELTLFSSFTTSSESEICSRYKGKKIITD